MHPSVCPRSPGLFQGARCCGIGTGMNHHDEVDEKLAQWMNGHHGVIGLKESCKLGASYRTARRNLARGEWDSPYTGVFRATSAPQTDLQRLRAACVASGGVVSHATAAWLWGLLRVRATPIEVTIDRRRRATRHKVDFIIHRAGDLDEAAWTTRKGIEVTTRVRTLVDLAATGTDEQLTEAVDTALGQRSVTVTELKAEIQRLSKPGRTGVGRLRKDLENQGFLDAPAPSVLEARARRLTKNLGIQVPEVEAVVDGPGRYRVDIAWRNIKFGVEVDGYMWHYSPKQKRRDELRRQRLREMGWTLLVFDWLQMTEESAWVATEIRTTFDRLTSQAP